jgi:hypothetical protein
MLGGRIFLIASYKETLEDLDIYIRVNDQELEFFVVGSNDRCVLCILHKSLPIKCVE